MNTQVPGKGLTRTYSMANRPATRSSCPVLTADLKSIVRHVVETGLEYRMYLYHGVRTQGDLFDADYFRMLEKEHPDQFSYRPVLSEEQTVPGAGVIIEQLEGKDDNDRMYSSPGTADVNGTRLAYEVAGDGAAVALVHGLGLDRRMWDDQMRALTPGHRVLRHDLRSFGQSADPREGEPYTHAADLRALMQTVGMSRATLVGLSLGGWVVLEFTLTYPDMVQNLVLVDPVVRGYSFPGGWNRSLVEVNRVAREQGLDAAKERWLADPVFERSRELPGVAARLKTMVDDFSGWQFLHDNPHDVLDPPAIERLGDVSARTLVVVGERDLPDFHGMAELLATEIPSAELVVLPGAGHMSNMDAPEAFNDAVLAFLGRSTS